MKGIHDHTLLMNEMIGFSVRIDNWPHPLHNFGYELKHIELRMGLPDKRTVNPDLIFGSNRMRHAIIAECKSGEKIRDEQITRERQEDNDEQVDKYASITKELLAQRLDMREPKELTWDILFACSSEKMGEFECYGYPVLAFEETRVTKVNKFQSTKIEKRFPPTIDLTEKPPTSFYPFCDLDEREYIAMYIGTQIVQMAIRSGKNTIETNTDELLEVIHPFWNLIHDEKKKALRKITESILADIASRPKFNKSIDKLDRKGDWKITKSLTALQEGLQELMEEYRRLPPKIESFGPYPRGDGQASVGQGITPSNGQGTV